MTASLKVTERKPGVHVAAISGSLDSNTSTDIESRLAPLLIPATDVLTLDLRDLEYISSAGVRVVFKARKAVEGNGGQFLLSNLQPSVRKVFEIINALPKENIFTSLREVDEYLDLMQKRVRSGGRAGEDE